jgi:hypothetical protein
MQNAFAAREPRRVLGVRIRCDWPRCPKEATYFSHFGRNRAAGYCSDHYAQLPRSVAEVAAFKREHGRYPHIAHGFPQWAWVAGMRVRARKLRPSGGK